MIKTGEIDPMKAKTKTVCLTCFLILLAASPTFACTWEARVRSYKSGKTDLYKPIKEKIINLELPDSEKWKCSLEFMSTTSHFNPEEGVLIRCEAEGGAAVSTGASRWLKDGALSPARLSLSEVISGRSTQIYVVNVDCK